MAQVLVVHEAAGRLVCGVAWCLKEQDEEGVTCVSAKWCLVLASLTPSVTAGGEAEMCRCLWSSSRVQLSLPDWEHPAGLGRTRCLVSAP